MLSDLIKGLIELIKFIPWKQLREFLENLIIKQRYALLLCILLFAASIGLIVKYLQLSWRYEEIVAGTLDADLEQTPQRYKGLEAFILSNVPNSVQADVGSSQLSEKFTKQLEKLKDALESFNSYKIPPPSLHPVKAANNTLLNDENENDRSFLYFPIDFIRPELNSQDRSVITNTNDLNENEQKERADLIRQRVINDRSLDIDVAITKQLGTALRGFAGFGAFKSQTGAADHLQSQPAQVYMITRRGLNRIYSNSVSSAEDYYGNQFPPTLIFPSRPYFQEAMKHVVDYGEHGENFLPKPESTIKDFFYVSKPYMDLGGNGIVITLARAVKYKDVTEFVICFDFPFAKGFNIDQALRERMDKFMGDGMSLAVACSAQEKPECNPTNGPASDSNLTDLQKNLQKRMEEFLLEKKQESNLSEVFGNIQVINGRRDPDGNLQISVPIEQASLTNGSSSGTFLLSNINITEYKRRTAYIGIASALTSALMVLVLAYLWGKTSRHRTQYQEALARVAKVMSLSPVAYLRLDESDCIHDYNAAFYTMLGCTEQSAAQYLKGRTLRGLCADQSKSVYDQVQEKRKNKERVDPYCLRLVRADGELQEVWVVSADVPSPRGILPETFGIFLTTHPDIART